jgi:hypothetical protein
MEATRSDILLFTETRPLAVDFAVTSPLQSKFILGAARTPKYAAEQYAKDVKEKK